MQCEDFRLFLVASMAKDTRNLSFEIMIKSAAWQPAQPPAKGVAALAVDWITAWNPLE